MSEVTISKFHSCNAHVKRYKGAELFVSYDTPIAMLTYSTSGEAYLRVSTEFRYSPTTIRQFSRWLREHGLNYYDVKDATDDVPHKAIQGPCTIFRGYAPAELIDIFAAPTK